MLTDIEREFNDIGRSFATFMLFIVSAPFYALGWLAGFLWRLCLWLFASIVAGFRSGLGHNETT